jgi:hypothetical protein
MSVEPTENKSYTDVLGEEPPEVKALFETLRKADEFQKKKKAALREEALANVGEFRKATAEYLKAVSNMKMPDCYLKSLVAYVEALNLYELESYACPTCDFKIGAINAFIVPRTQEEVDRQKKAADEQTKAYEDDKKINIYHPEPEKNAEQVTAADPAVEGDSDILQRNDEDEPRMVLAIALYWLQVMP